MILLFSGTTPLLDVWQFRFGAGGVVLNGAAVLPFVDIMEINGLDAPPIRLLQDDRDGEHGGYSYAKYYGPRTVEFKLDIYLEEDEDFLDRLKTNFAPKDEGDWLFWKPPGENIRMLYCKPVGFRYPITRTRSYHKIEGAQLIFQADDPRWYGTSSMDIVTFPATVLSGRTYPKTYPFTYGYEQAGGSIVLTNGGSVESQPVFSINGPVSNPVIRNHRTGRTMYLDIALGPSDTLNIDCVNKLIVLNSNNAVDVLRTPDSEWLELVPGTNELSFTCTSAGLGAQIAITSRDAWR